MAIPILSALPLLGTVLDSAIELFTGDDKRQAELLREQINNGHMQVMGQLEVNKAEAAHSSLFVAGWRPFIGWVCGAGFAFTYIVKPFIFPWFYADFPQLAALPDIDDGLMELTLGMLGIAGLRTWEKKRGLTK